MKCSTAVVSVVLPAGNDAVIAQSVERILGKDEVASSNLANSSIVLPLETGRFKRFSLRLQLFGVFLACLQLLSCS